MEQLNNLATSYISFLNKIGAADLEHIQEQHFPPIWAENCQKITNGNVLYKKGSSFLTQLQEARKLAGKWQVDLKEVLTEEQGRMSAVRYDLKSEVYGSFQVCAFLTFDDNNLLIEINEVCRKA